MAKDPVYHVRQIALVDPMSTMTDQDGKEWPCLTVMNLDLPHQSLVLLLRQVREQGFTEEAARHG